MSIIRGAVSGLLILAAHASAQTTPGKNSLKPIAKTDWDRAAAAHLLARAGFSGTPAEVDKLAAMSLSEAVDYLVEFDKIPFRLPPADVPDDVDDRPDRAELANLTPEERQKLIDKRQRAAREAMQELRLWWIERMVVSPRPLEEKMTLFWHGHFTSGAREVRNPKFMLAQNELLRRECLGNFRDLVLGVSKDCAMLVYLDGNRNSKERPNENYARELMELFTLGVGNYTETDVKEAARAFTGWGIEDGAFVFRRRQHDPGEKTFLGRKGRYDGEDIVDIILDQPQCSKYIASRILGFFVRPEPEKELVDALAYELRKNKYELAPTMKTLFRSQAFYHADSRGTLVKGPVELLVSSARRFGVTVENLLAAERAMAAMGQELMQPPNVKGWPGGAKWINTATLFSRYNFVSTLIQGGGAQRTPRVARNADEDPAGESMASPSMAMTAEAAMPPRSRMTGAAQPAIDPIPAIRDHDLRTAEQIVDFFSRELLAVPLSGAKRERLIAFLDNGKTFDPAARGADDRLRQMLALLCSTPEFQLY